MWVTDKANCTVSRSQCTGCWPPGFIYLTYLWLKKKKKKGTNEKEKKALQWLLQFHFQGTSRGFWNKLNDLILKSNLHSTVLSLVFMSSINCGDFQEKLQVTGRWMDDCSDVTSCDLWKWLFMRLEVTSKVMKKYIYHSRCFGGVGKRSVIERLWEKLSGKTRGRHPEREQNMRTYNKHSRELGKRTWWVPLVHSNSIFNF